jgi:hypothetical protein
MKIAKIFLLAAAVWCLTMAACPSSGGGSSSPITAITLKEESLSLAVDAMADLEYTVTPKGYTGSVIWSIGNKNVIAVEDLGGGVAEITGLKAGESTLMARSAEDNTIKSDKITVTVTGGSSSNPITGITLGAASLAVTTTAPGSLTYTVAPAEYTGSIEWVIGNTAVISVASAGAGTVTVTGLQAGTSTLKARSVQNTSIQSAQITVTVSGGGASNPITGITLGASSLAVTTSTPGSLTYTVAPTGYTGSIEWVIGDNTVISVANAGAGTATVTGLKAGTSTLRARSVQNTSVQSAQITVTVSGGDPNLPKTWTFTNAADLIAAGWKDDGATNNDTDVTLSGGLKLTASSRSTRLDTSKSCIQPNGSGDWGEISGFSGTVKVTVTYSSTGSNASNPARHATITVGGETVTGPADAGSSSQKTVTATGSGTFVLGGDGSLRYYEVKVENP